MDSLSKIGIQSQRFDYELVSGVSMIDMVFDDNKPKTIISKELRTVTIKDISKHIIRKAIWQNDFYKFDNLTQYLGELESIDQFMIEDGYL